MGGDSDGEGRPSPCQPRVARERGGKPGRCTVSNMLTQKQAQLTWPGAGAGMIKKSSRERVAARGRAGEGLMEKSGFAAEA